MTSFRKLVASVALAATLVTGCGAFGSDAPAPPGATSNGTGSASSQGVAASPETYEFIDSLPPNGTSAQQAGLNVQLVGDCGTDGGMRLKSSGFTPGGRYQTTATYPDGRTPYTYLSNGGVGSADQSGATPFWTWNCFDGSGGESDPEGDYKIRITDIATNAASPGRWVEFTVPVRYLG